MYLTIVEAVILILKHATFLRLSNPSPLYFPPEEALTQAEQDYQKANIDLKIQQHLVASSQEQSVEQFASFVMATDIGFFIPASVKTISHTAFSAIFKAILVFSPNTCA